MPGDLGFEKPIIELKEKIKELRSFTEEKDIDLTDEIAKLETRLQQLENEIYGNLQPWERVQIARHSERPTTLDYISHLFTDFIELHGDRLFGDDEAIVGGIAKYKGKAIFSIYTKSEFSKMFSTSRLDSRSLTFCVMPVGMPPHLRKRFQISTE